MLGTTPLYFTKKIKMKYTIWVLWTTALVFSTNTEAQEIDFSKLKSIEHKLDDVMEIIDTVVLKVKLKEVELDFKENRSELNKLRLAIIYHETALNLGLITKSNFQGYAKKSYEILSELNVTPTPTKELLPFITSYRASAISLMAAETKKIGLIHDAFKLFEQSIERYGKFSYSPEFLRGSVSENLPWIFFSKKRFAKIDMQSILDKQTLNEGYANGKIMSYVYWAWANKRRSKKFRAQALEHLDRALALDPNFTAGGRKAQKLKAELLN